MKDLRRCARLTEEIMRRTLRRYQEKLHAEDYHRRVIEQTLQELPRIVQDCLADVATGRQIAVGSRD